MSDSKADMSDLFRSLRAETSRAQPISNGAATTAEQRWPILKSFQPRKLAVSTLLSEDEKQVRRRVDPVVGRGGQASPNANSVHQQLARGLSRMLVQKQVIALSEITLSRPVDLVTPAIASTSPAPAPRVPPPSASVLPGFEGLRSANLEPTRPSASPVSSFFRRPADESPPVQDAEISPPVQDDSLLAVLMRLEQAHQAPQATAPKPPAFMSRLGKR